MARLVNTQIIFTTECHGNGTEADPMRSVEQWWSPDGTLLLQYDPHLDKTTMAINMIEFLRREECKGC